MIAVKKSEFIEEYERNARSMAGAEAAAKAVEMAGMEWLPEEPELPERVELSTLNAASFSAAMLKWKRLGPKETMGWNEAEDRRVYAEARDCYNAVRRWERANPGSAHTVFGKILQEERGKLQ